MEQFDIPITIIFFIRADTLKRVFERVKQIKPKELFLIQDGPRDDTDIPKIEECRKIVEDIDWKCNVHKNYSAVNLGCGKRPYTGISWTFEHVDESIILEDDCLPNLSFFTFCKQMLEKYKDDERVMIISGTNHLIEYKKSNNESYFFSKSLAIWGWATWKRAWDKYDYTIKRFENKDILDNLKDEIKIKNAYKDITKACKNTELYLSQNLKLSWWDYQWHFCLYINSGLGIVPKYNLISNIGFGNDSTHFNKLKNKKYRFENMQTKELESNLIHPNYIMCDWNYDRKVYNIICPHANIFKRVIFKILRVLKIKK